MAQNTLPDYLVIIKQQINSQQTLLQYYTEMESIVEMIIGKEMLRFPRAKLSEYLWKLSDLMSEAQELNEGIVKTLMEIDPSCLKPRLRIVRNDLKSK